MSVHNIGSLVFIYWYKIVDNCYAVYAYADKKSLIGEKQRDRALDLKGYQL